MLENIKDRAQNVTVWPLCPPRSEICPRKELKSGYLESVQFQIMTANLGLSVKLQVTSRNGLCRGTLRIWII